ncbi:unnamed protein product, partial [Symbiodinium natans]
MILPEWGVERGGKHDEGPATRNCVALHNHRFFSGMVTSGAAAWLLAAVAVAMGLEPQALLHQPTWPMLLAVAFI